MGIKYKCGLTKCLLFVVLVLFSLNIQAQPHAVTVKMPAFKRFVKLTAENVNFRRLPNVNSGKIMAWNSDGGSADTYTMLYYSDTEKNKYKVGGLSGAYNSAYSSFKGATYPVSDFQNGWYCVEVAGDKNAKNAWVKGSFCQELSVKEGGASSVTIPSYFYWNPQQYMSFPGTRVSLNQMVHRNGGIYKNLRFITGVSSKDGKISIAFPMIVGDFCVVVRQEVFITYKANCKTPNLTIYEMEGMDELLQELHFNVPNVTAQKAYELFFKYLGSCTDSDFGKIVKIAFPEDGYLPRDVDEVYFLGTDGKSYDISYAYKTPTSYFTNTKKFAIY